MAFEVFDKRKSSLKKTPSATLQKRGILSLNASGHELINSASSVELLYDSKEKIIALRPSDAPHAYEFRQANKKTGQVIVSLTAFTEYYDIDTSQSQRFIPRKEGEMLCLDLDQGSTIVGNRAKEIDEGEN